jgi:hypothetical protein
MGVNAARRERGELERGASPAAAAGQEQADEEGVLSGGMGVRLYQE